MTIGELLSSIKVKRVIGTLNREIKGIAYDSRDIKDGFLFVAIKGFSTDGHIYIKEAIKNGAKAIVIQEILDTLSPDVTLIEVQCSREALALLSSSFYGEPYRGLSLIGITGTNGKTTTSYITKGILDEWGKKVGLLGTIHYIIGAKATTPIRTTPESLDLQRYLRQMLNQEVQYAVLEVSSHALALKRVEGCRFKVAAFTNFSQDHLDFHGTMEGYFAAKVKLFDYLEREGYAVLNWDDPHVRSLAKKLNCNIITCGSEWGAMIRAVDINSSLFWGLSFKVHTPKGELFISSPLMGRNNVYNILMSVGIAYALGVDKEAIIRGIKKVSYIEGRFERVDAGQKFLCIVDYAHTEDALKRLIEEAKLITKGRIITVFGCGGDRDKGKRPRMGAVATELSDLVVITSDNPRGEEPMQIINDILKGIRKDNYTVLPDRAEAIRQAVSMAEEGDTVLVAGKGHEDYIEIKGIRYPFSDRETLKRELTKNQNTKSENKVWQF